MSSSLVSLCLGAVMLGSLAAAAAERPAPESAPRACPRYGPGFVEMPGTATCIRIGGRVVSEFGGSARRVSRDDIAGFGTGARVSVDARTDTPYGPLRSYVRVRAGSGFGHDR